MKICVCGWYYNSEIYDTLSKVTGHDVHVVGHRDAPAFVMDNFSFVQIPNIGLEFGAYDHFIKNASDLSGGVLFMHDDVSLSDVSIFDQISACGHDQAFIFRDELDGRSNQNFHGRMWFASERFLREILTTQCDCHQARDYVDKHNNHFCSHDCATDARQRDGWTNVISKETYRKDQGHKRCMECGLVIKSDEYVGTVLRGQGPHTGIWFDRENTGHSRGCPPVGVRHYNDAIWHLAWQCSVMNSSKGFDARRVLYYPSINLYKRGVPR